MSTAPYAATDSVELDRTLQTAHDAAEAWSATPPAGRATVLENIADALEDAGGELIPLGMGETSLAEARLSSELKRTAFQLRLFSEVLRDGSFLDVRIDHADPDWPMGAPRPDLRRWKRPIGTVLVFSASNFPFAFSVAGGDTASALAAGNPVVVKAHEGHPELSERTAGVVRSVLRDSGASKDLLGLIHGREAGAAAVQDSRIRAAGFTGSIPGGRALFDLAVSRPDPIPFYGELGSNNPVFVTPGAAAARGEEITEGFLGSFTMGAGQFCTKPGTLFVPAGSNLVEGLRAAELPEVHPLLSPGIGEGHSRALTGLSEHSGVQVLAGGEAPGADADTVHPSPTLLLTSAEALLADPEALEAECFGPTALVVEYDAADGLDQAVELARTFEGQLTASVFAEENCPVEELLEVLAGIAGRVVWNQWPTGVSVTHAQQHGGPYPATTAVGSTSVGTAAVERFLRPVAYQNLPQRLLPPELRDADPSGTPQMIDGRRRA